MSTPQLHAAKRVRRYQVIKRVPCAEKKLERPATPVTYLLLLHQVWESSVEGRTDRLDNNKGHDRILLAAAVCVCLRLQTSCICQGVIIIAAKLGIV